MNRRSFISNFTKGIIAAGAGFTILPGAGRIWRAERKQFIGIYQMLIEAGKRPYTGPLNIPEFLKLNYEIMRAREARGVPQEISIWVSEEAANWWRHVRDTAGVGSGLEG